MSSRVQTDADRPPVWVLDEDGVTCHPGREHARRGRLVLARWETPAALRYEQWVAAGRVAPREVEQ